MKSTRKGHGRILDLWDPPENAGDALVCLATSFTFDAGFFETECIGRFLNMDSHPSESESVGYLIEREEKLADARICALVDRRHARDKESLRWDILPVLVPHAIQHAKLSLLLWGNHLRVIIGSANLTEPGYRSNLEVCGSLDLARTDGGLREHVSRCVDFLGSVIDLVVGDNTREGPIRRARESLRFVRRHIRNWPDSASSKRLGIPIFSGIGVSVLSQLESEIPTKLPCVCRRLRIPLRRHDAGSDAVACARIVLVAEAAGWLPGKRRTRRTATPAMVRAGQPFRAEDLGSIQWRSSPHLPVLARLRFSTGKPTKGIPKASTVSSPPSGRSSRD